MPRQQKFSQNSVNISRKHHNSYYFPYVLICFSCWVKMTFFHTCNLNKTAKMIRDFDFKAFTFYRWQKIQLHQTYTALTKRVLAFVILQAAKNITLGGHYTALTKHIRKIWIRSHISLWFHVTNTSIVHSLCYHERKNKSLQVSLSCAQVLIS